MTEEFLSFDDTLEELQLSEDELKNMVSEGKLRAFRQDDEIVFLKEDVEGIKGEPLSPFVTLKQTHMEKPQHEQPAHKESFWKKLGKIVINIIAYAVMVGIFIVILHYTREKEPKIPKTVTIEDYQFIENNKVLTETIICKFNDIGDMTEKTYYDADGKLTKKTLYKYDDKNNSEEGFQYDIDGNLIKKFLCKYDDMDNIVEELEYDADGKLIERIIHKYNYLYEEYCLVSYDADNQLNWKAFYHYGSSGNLIETEDGASNIRVVHKYDDRDNNNEDIWYNEDGQLDGRTRYEYDNDDWLIEEIDYELDRETSVIKEFPVRKIIYKYEFYE